MSIPENPRAVVTGGGGGLGRGFCVELGKRHGKVIVADVNLDGAEESARLVRDAGGEAHAVRCDVSILAEVEKLAAVAEERFGGADLLVNNAGVAVSGAVGDIPMADWSWIVSINFFGVVHGCHVFVPLFKRRKSGHILNVASAAGLVSSTEMAPYNMTKAAVVALSETLHGELRGSGAGVTVVCPTFFQTNIVKHGRSHTSPRMETIAQRLMEKSKLQANDVARIALDGAAANTLYVVPMADGRWAWRAKRLAPQFFYGSLVPRALRAMRKKLAP